MNQECRDVILKHFVKLMKNCDVHILKIPLINKGVFKETEWRDIFETYDERHNKRVFFFTLQKKSNAWVPFLDSLEETHQGHISNLLCRKGPTVFSPLIESPDDEVAPQDLNDLKIPINTTTKPLNVRVIHSKQLYDTEEHNKKISFYSSRSKKRGRVLIINNYQFHNDNTHPYRNGALVDDKNLKALFHQMGGWDLECYHNKTTSEMDLIIKNFASYGMAEKRNDYDICFVLIMSHGTESSNDTIIYGVEDARMNNCLHVTKIMKLFTNENCRSWRGKPKVMFFPICRGTDFSLPIKHEPKTETDSIFPKKNNMSSMNLRTEEDMLVGFSTALGFKSHRDPNRGSWYIELLCEEFMNHAHEYSVSDMLMLVDQGLRRRLSTDHTMQTAEFRNLGFKKLYLNPGLYFENGVKRYQDD